MCNLPDVLYQHSKKNNLASGTLEGECCSCCWKKGSRKPFIPLRTHALSSSDLVCMYVDLWLTQKGRANIKSTVIVNLQLEKYVVQSDSYCNP